MQNKIRHIAASEFEQLDDEVKEGLRMSGVVPVLDPYMELYDLPKDVNMVILIGGRGSGKTWSACQKAEDEITVKDRRVAILRDEAVTIRESILNDVFKVYDDGVLMGRFDQSKYDKSAKGIRNKDTGNWVLFTKGFRASSTAKKSNLKGVSDTDTSIIEEADDIRDFKKFNTFKDSIRTKGRLFIVILNTPDIHHWIVKRYFNKEEAIGPDGQPIDGFFKITPKNIPSVRVIQTTYKQNPYLEDELRRDYDAAGDPNSERYDPEYYFGDILGYASSGRKGQILKKVKPITLAEYMAIPYREYYGQDFGTAAPAGTVGVKIHRNKSWARQINYKPKEAIELGKMYCDLKFNIADEITADSAEPQTIKLLHDGWSIDKLDEEDFRKYPQLAIGWNIKGVRKPKGSVNFGLDTMIGMDLYAVEESTDLWEEIVNYIWKVDKDDKATGDPMDGNDHLISPWRYVIFRHSRPVMGSTGG